MRQSSLISLFRHASQLMVEELVQRLAAAGYDDLPAAYHPVFENIDRDGTRLTALAARAHLTHQSMGELVGTLEDRGYVERAQDPADRRVRLVRLTAKGRRMVRVALVEIAAIDTDWLRRLRSSDPVGDIREALRNAVAQAHPTDDARRGRAPRRREDS